MNSLRITERQVLSELYLAILGEQCLFTTQKVNDAGFRIVEEMVKRQLSEKIETKMEMIVNLSNCVRSIELWKRRQTVAMEDTETDQQSGTKRENKKGTLGGNINVHKAIHCEIKKAIVESLLEDYNVYLNTADEMRIEHIGQRADVNISGLIPFAMEWNYRLQFLNSLARQVEERSGIEMMSLLYREWNLHCMRDWTYSLLKHALHRGSAALHRICANWLLEGRLTETADWFVKLQKNDAEGNNRSRRSDSMYSLNASINSTASADYELMPAEQQKSIISGLGLENKLVIPVVINGEVIPSSMANSPKMLEMILDIGRKVHFLKVLRSQRFYEHRADERVRLLGELKPEVWCNYLVRGKLSIALDALNRIVCEDTLQELMGRQRLMDHLCLVHAHFFMIRGELSSQLEQMIQMTASKPSQSYYTPFSSRKHRSNAQKIAEMYLNGALVACAPPPNIADLMHLLASEKARGSGNTRNKSVYESFELTFVMKAKKNETKANAIAEFLSRDVLRTYKKIFGLVVNLQMQRFQLDTVAHKFTHEVTRKMTRQKESQKFLRSIQLSLQNVRAFFARLANYIFEDALLLESTSILQSIEHETNPHGLLYRHRNLLNEVMLAMFIFSGADAMNRALVECIRRARVLTESVNELCDHVTRCPPQGDDGGIAQLHWDECDLRQSVRQYENIENVVSRKTGRVQATVHGEKLASLAFSLIEANKAFKLSQSNLRSILEHFIADGSRTTTAAGCSRYWPKLFALLFPTMNN